MRHPMSQCPDFVTLEVKTEEVGVKMSLSPRPAVAHNFRLIQGYPYVSAHFCTRYEYNDVQ
jgi:hypothetical protein